MFTKRHTAYTRTHMTPHVVTIHHSACRGDSPPPAVFGNHRAREATSHCLSNVFSSPSKAARPLRTSQPTPLPLPPHLFFLQIPSSFLSLPLSPFFSVCSLELTASPSSLPSLPLIFLFWLTNLLLYPHPASCYHAAFPSPSTSFIFPLLLPSFFLLYYPLFPHCFLNSPSSHHPSNSIFFSMSLAV